MIFQIVLSILLFLLGFSFIISLSVPFSPQEIQLYRKPKQNPMRYLPISGSFKHFTENIIQRVIKKHLCLKSVLFSIMRNTSNLFHSVDYFSKRSCSICFKMNKLKSRVFTETLLVFSNLMQVRRYPELTAKLLYFLPFKNVNIAMNEIVEVDDDASHIYFIIFYLHSL